MSATSAIAHRTGTGERVQLFRAHQAIGAVVGLACLLLFTLAAGRLLRARFLPGLIAAVWTSGAHPQAIGGRWVVALLVALAHHIPDAGPEVLIVATVVTAAAILGGFAALLRRRRWPAWQAALAALLLAVHPVMLWLATTGQPALLAMLMVGLLILSVDRAEAIGDAQSLMGMGLTAALLCLTSPNAIYVVLPVMMLLPVALRGMDSAAAAVSLLLLAAIPSIVVVGGILVAMVSIGLDAASVIRLWSAPLHGSLDPVRLSAPFLSAFGGRFFASLRVMLWLSVAAMPPVLVVALRLATRRVERARPATALLTLLLAPFGGAVAMLAMHQSTPIVTIGYTMAAAMAWMTTTNLTRLERVAWLLMMAAGDVAVLLLPWVWEGRNGAWLRAMLAAR